MPAKKAAETTAEFTKPNLHISSKFNEKAEKPEKPEFGGHILPSNKKRVHLKGQRFIITAAQNNTEVNAGFLKALEACAKETGAQILVSRFTYN